MTDYTDWKTQANTCNGKPRCDACVEKQRLEVLEAAQMRRANLALVVKSTDSTPPSMLSTAQIVQIFRPACSEPKDININAFWERGGNHRFKNHRCVSQVCTLRTNLGKWNRHLGSDTVIVQDWLKYNKCDKSKDRPAKITPDLYRTQVITSAEGNKTTKRQMPSPPQEDGQKIIRMNE